MDIERLAARPKLGTVASQVLSFPSPRTECRLRCVSVEVWRGVDLFIVRHELAKDVRVQFETLSLPGILSASVDVRGLSWIL